MAALPLRLSAAGRIHLQPTAYPPILVWEFGSVCVSGCGDAARWIEMEVSAIGGAVF